MTFPTVDKSVFTSLPNYPGLPPLARSDVPLGDGGGEVADDEVAQTESVDPLRWEIVDYDSGEPIGPYTAIRKSVYTGTAEVATVPIEGGKLAAYNKVVQPETLAVDIIADSSMSLDDRTLLLEQVIAAKNDVSLWTIVTDTGAIDRMTVTSVNSDRSIANKTAAALILQVTFKQVLLASVTETTATPAEPEATKTAEDGRVQTTPDAAIDDGLWI